MAKSGRPPKHAGDQGTKQVRVNEDIAEMLSDLSLVHPKSTAQILDPLIREEVVELHRRYLPKILEAKAVQTTAEEALKKIQEEAEKLANDQPKKGKRAQ